MAEYIASGVSTVASRAGIDGGMNPVFVAKLSPQSGFDNNGRIQLASTTTGAPGALPRVATAPGALPRTTTVVPPAASAQAPAQPEPAATDTAPVAVASVPMPRVAPQPKQGEAPTSKPTTIAGLIGTWFNGSKSEADSSTREKEQVAARTADLTIKPKQSPAAPVRTASAGASVPLHTTASPPAPAAKPREAATKPVAAPASTSAPTSPWPATPQPAKTEPPAQQPEIRTASSTPAAGSNGLLTGAQPVVPAGSFNSFR
jgi:hypothetical protein